MYALEFGTDEVDMDERRSVLENDVAHIKVDITDIKVDMRDLRGKLDAANDAIFRSREETATEFGKVRQEMATGFGAHAAALEKAVGELRTLIKEESGKSRFWNAMTQVWVLLAFATAFGFLGRALSWW
jgi:hypothetical protein